MTPYGFWLPWPPSTLSPNARPGHAWAQTRRAQKRYRDACYVSVLADKVRKPTAARLDLLLLFVPPDRRQYDRDNLVARMKAGLDGLALAWGIDDAAFVRIAAEVVATFRRPLRNEAMVRVEVREHVPGWGAPASEGAP